MRFQILVVCILIVQIWGQLIPVKEVEIKDIDVKPAEQKQGVQNPKLALDKIYETDQIGLEVMSKTFKNIVLWVYGNNFDEVQEANLSEALKMIKKLQELDIIFLKSASIDKNAGIYVYHLQQEYPCINFQDLSLIQLVNQVMDIISPSIKILESEQEVELYLSGIEPKLLLIMESGHQFYKFVYDKFQEMLREGTLNDAGVDDIKIYNASQYKQYKQPSLLLHKQNEEIERYDNNITYFDQIQDFIYLESLPIIVPLSEKYLSRVFGGPIGTQFHLLIDKNNNNNTILLQNLADVALNNKINDLYYQRIIFTYSSYEDNIDLWSQFDFNNQTRTPQLVVTKTNFRKFQLEKYKHNDSIELSKESMGEFIQQFSDHKIAQFFRSDSIENAIEKDGVLNVVGSTFTQEVIKGRQNTLVLFWDSKNPSASIELEAIVREISKELAEDKKEFLKICIFDLANNEHPSIILDRAPVLHLYLAGDKRRPKDYNMLIEKEQLQAWLSYWISDLELVQFDDNGYRPINQTKLTNNNNNSNTQSIKTEL